MAKTNKRALAQDAKKICSYCSNENCFMKHLALTTSENGLVVKLNQDQKKQLIFDTLMDCCIFRQHRELMSGDITLLI